MMNRNTGASEGVRRGAGGRCGHSARPRTVPSDHLNSAVAYRSSVSGLALIPVTSLPNTIAGGECEIGTPGRKSMIDLFSALYFSVRAAASAVVSASLNCAKSWALLKPHSSFGRSKKVPMKLYASP